MNLHISPRRRRRSTGAPPRRTPAAAILAVVLMAALAVNVETTIVNVALPTLNIALDASTRELQWIVDAYNLAFAALVLAGGTLGDRFGRRDTLIAGLALFATSSVAAALCTTSDQLIGVRVVMGVASALIYPTTLAIITDTFREPRTRAAAIGAWGAVTGLGVALGPILGGALLERFWWGSLFVALVPIALIAAAATPFVIASRAAGDRRPLDYGGAALSAAMLGTLVYTIIEAPQRGWASTGSLVGFAAAAVAAIAFTRWELHARDPLIDVSLFANLRFSAASGAVAVAFFALFGFIFLITQFMQLLQGNGPLETGVRVLPVALSIAAGSLLGTRLAVTRIGTRVVVCSGLLMMAAAFGWVATIRADTPYLTMALQMGLLGAGLGLTTAPATDSIMGVVRPDQAGAGSALNDATRQVGGTLGVAVVGSVFASQYVNRLATGDAIAALPEPARRVAEEGLAQALAVAARASGTLAAAVRHEVSDAFVAGLHVGSATAAAACLVGAFFVGAVLPAHPRPSNPS